MFVYELHTGGEITGNNVNGVPLRTLMEGDEGKTSSLVTLTLLLAQPDLRFVKKKIIHFFIQKTRVNLWSCGLSRLPPFLAKKILQKRIL